MKPIICMAALLLTLPATAQDKKHNTHYDKLTDLKGTDFVIASVNSIGKKASNDRDYLLFINARTGESNMAAIPDSTAVNRIEQVHIDSLNLNIVILEATTVRKDIRNKDAWIRQLYVLSTDGRQIKLISDVTHFVQAWTVNYRTGHIVITGHYDTNANGKRDLTDKNGIVIFDLKAMKEMSRF